MDFLSNYKIYPSYILFGVLCAGVVSPKMAE